MGGDGTVAGLFAVCHPENIIKKGKRERERKGGRKKEKKRKKGGKVTLLAYPTLEKEMANHSSTLTWKIPWTEERGRLQSMGSRVGHD